MISTALTAMFGLRHPIVLAPMGAVSGGALAAAVTNAGGLGLVGGGYGNVDWMRTELGKVRSAARGPWGVGLITWAITPAAFEVALESRPHAFMLSFGDPHPYAPAIKAAGCKLICQVQNIEQALVARDAGADLIVAQGAEGGGHGATRATLTLVPAVVDAVAPLPVIAAGGIGDGRGLAAALMLGAHGVLIGTRFYASNEALCSDDARNRIVAAKSGDTQRTRIFDIIRGFDWPMEFTGRALRNRFFHQWHGRESELTAVSEAERPAYWDATRKGDHDTAVVWAGEVVDLIDSVESAAVLVEGIAAEAEALLRSASRWIA
jgi:nitronate monooxygenase